MGFYFCAVSAACSSRTVRHISQYMSKSLFISSNGTQSTDKVTLNRSCGTYNLSYEGDTQCISLICWGYEIAAKMCSVLEHGEQGLRAAGRDHLKALVCPPGVSTLRLPLASWSFSIASKRDLKFPAPKPWREHKRESKSHFLLSETYTSKAVWLHHLWVNNTLWCLIVASKKF